MSKLDSAIGHFNSLDSIELYHYEIVNNPDKTLIEYREHLPQEENYLKIIMEAITSKELTYSPLIDDVGKTLINWFKNLPTVTKFSSNLSEECKKFIVDMKEITKNDNSRDTKQS